MKKRLISVLLVLLSMGISVKAQQNYPSHVVKSTPIEGLSGSSFITGLVIHSTCPDTVFVSSAKGLYCSKNGGETWEFLYVGIQNRISMVTLDPLQGNVVYAASSDFLYKSENLGKDWTLLLGENTWHSNLAIPTGQSDTLYFANSNLNVSYDGGDNWEVIAPNSVDVFVSSASSNILIESRNNYVSSPDDVRLSINKGDSWTAIADTLVSYIYDPLNTIIDTLYDTEYFLEEFVFDYSDENIFYIVTSAGIFKTLDKGMSFFKTNIGYDGGSLVIDPHTPNILYAASEFGYYKSTDRGDNWTVMKHLASDGNYSTHPQCLAISDDGEVFWGEFSGRFFQKKGDESWTEKGVKGMRNFDIHSLMASQTGDTLVVGLDNIQYTDNKGANWATIPSSYTSRPTGITHVARVPNSWDDFYVGGDGNKIYKTTNQGLSFQQVFPSGDQQPLNLKILVIDQLHPETVYIAYEDSGLYKSSNGGILWEQKNNGFDTLRIFSLVIHPENSNILYAAAEGVGVYKSTDGAESWVLINNGINKPNISQLKINPIAPDMLFASTFFGHETLYKTSNAGLSWDSIYVYDLGGHSIEFDLQDTSRVFMLRDEQGVLESNNGGKTWEPWYQVNDDFTSFMKMTPHGIYASMNHEGLILINDVKLDTVLYNTSVNCINDSTARIEIKTMEYYQEAQYSIDGGKNISSDSVFLNLPAGQYYPIVIVGTDTLSKGMIDIGYQQNVFIDLPDDLALTTNDTAYIDATDAFYSYHWSNGVETQINPIYGPELGVGSFYLSLIVSDEMGCESTDSILVNITPYTHIATLIQTEIEVFPNPVQSQLVINSDDLKLNTYKIHDITGCIVKKGIVIKNSIDVSDLHSGIYFIQFDTKYSAKFMKANSVK